MQKNIEFAEFQKIAKDVLGRVSDFCDEHQLRYFLDYGTLLGAARHQDMIPWDYDIDIAMPRKDYNKFLELTQKENTIPNTTVFSCKTHKDYYLPFAKICDNRTRLVITETTSKLPLGIWVDIFPLDGLSDDVEEMTKIQQIGLGYVAEADRSVLVVKTFRERISKFIAKIRSLSVPPAYWIEKAADLMKDYPYDKFNYVGCAVSMDGPVKDEYIKKEWVSDFTDLKLGDRTFHCPIGYHERLKMLYGDYMQLPPEEKRSIPHLKSYWIE